MAKAIHTCTGCVPIDASIIEAYVALITMNKNVSDAEDAREEAEDARVLAENARVNAEASRVDVESSRVNAEAARALAENARVEAETARETQAGADHTRAGEDHSTAVADHTQAGEDHTASETATTRANEAAAAAEHMVDIKRGPKGDQGNTGSSVDYPYELVNNVTTDDATKGLSAAQGVVLDGKISQLGQQVIYDVSVNNDGATFASLSALLSDENLSTLIPVAVRCGGMSIRFVQTSDNKYVHFNLLAQSFTTDVTQWAIDDEGVYVENPEYAYVKTDADDKILWAIKPDGSIYWGAGVPQQVIDYVNEKISELSLDEYEDIVAFLNGLEEGDKTLQTLLNEKVDKEEGKSLISSDFAETQSTVENHEYLKVITDSDSKILQGIKSDGTSYMAGDLQVEGDASINGDATVRGNVNLANGAIQSVDNPEYIDAKVDSEDKILEGITTEGIKNINIPIDNGAAIIESSDNPEWLDVLVDAEGNIIRGTRRDGSTYIGEQEFKELAIDTLNIEKELVLSDEAKEKLENDINVVNKIGLYDEFTRKNISSVKSITMEKWTELRFGLFIHWGMFSAWAGKYDGVDIDGNEVHTTSGTEWMWWSYKIPKDTYKSKTLEFSSDGWNPDAICKMALSVGMKYIVLTIRHHEGFSLIPTEHCEWDVTASSASSDIVMQLKNACDRHGLKFGVYISALLDWNDYGGFGQDRWNNGADPYTEDEHISFTKEQAEYCRQIVDTYKPFLIWFDGGTYIRQGTAVRETFVDAQMRHFPFEITNDRGSTWTSDWGEIEDMSADNPNDTHYLERCSHIAGWAYNASRDTAAILDNENGVIWDMIEAMGRGFNYLLNVPPKGDGSISENYINWFKRLSNFCRKYTHFTGAKRLFNNCQPNWGRPMYIGNSVYMFILPDSGSNIYVDSIDTGNLKGVYIYNIVSPDSTDNYEIISEDRLLIKNVPTSSDDYFIVVRLDFNGAVLCDDYNYVDTSLNTLSLVRVSSKGWADVPTCIMYNSKRYFIGEDDSVIKTRFKYVGETGTKTFNFIIETIGTNSVSVDFIDETDRTTQTVALTNDSLSNVALTNGHMYTMNLSKTGSGNLRISNIIEIN